MSRMSFQLQKDADRNDAQTLGHVAYLMSKSNAYQSYPMACLVAWIEPAIAVQQIKIFFDVQGRSPVGYITWALLAPDVEKRWLHDPKVLLHFSEWNEGEKLWVMDLVAPFGHCQDIVRYARDQMFKDHDMVYSLRRAENGSLRKQSIWHR